MLIYKIKLKLDVLSNSMDSLKTVKPIDYLMMNSLQKTKKMFKITFIQIFIH